MRPAATAANQCWTASFSLFFPDDCRVCETPLKEVSRIPVCAACLKKPRPFASECFCPRCGAPFRHAIALDGDGSCGECAGTDSGFDAAYAFGPFDAELRELIHLFKYGRVEALAKPLGRMLALALPAEERFEAIVPMPLHWRRRWSRGFNQAGLLARELAAATGTGLVHAVRRSRSTEAQARLSRTARQANVRGAFVVRRPAAIAGKRVLLVDDVMTTGATLSACARAMKRAGASRVAAITLARAGVDFQVSAGAPQEGAFYSQPHSSGSFEDAQSGSPA